MQDILDDVGHATWLPFSVIAARLVLAAVLGAIIGFEREWRNHPAPCCPDGHSGARWPECRAVQLLQLHWRVTAHVHDRLQPEDRPEIRWWQWRGGQRPW